MLNMSASRVENMKLDFMKLKSADLFVLPFHILVCINNDICELQTNIINLLPLCCQYKHLLEDHTGLKFMTADQKSIYVLNHGVLKLKLGVYFCIEFTHLIIF
ncbi:hypothetical protein O6H91_04G024200 [Diphasiastrum complanatum]|uniref:Uncharacterized protein n=1 Tax=Diphasiastrum complanatum TaxID=34168 RepID=A0ACC2DVN8_DIPCM|nr:hypothetical protein O6H91_Y481900 [Diphasiastrum complanatum]KAJ7558077.1 hypothetical protein O6H91_04G024200 [Diphasiastrum complanatum]